MAHFVHSFFFASFFFALYLGASFAWKNDCPVKSLNLTLYEQGIINKTAFFTVNGVNTAQTTSQYIFPFGNLFTFDDTLTVQPNRSSEVVGTLQGFLVTSTLDGLQSTNIMKATIRSKTLKGSISVVGAAPNTSPGEFTVVGGTEDFLLVQGYLALTPTDLSFPSYTYKHEFHLYWPPYTTN